MTVSMRVMSLGAGYRYLLNSVVSGDGERDLTEPLTRYYAEAGTPPGAWLGTGLQGLGNGELAAGDVVTEDHLRLLLGKACDPITGEPLGRNPAQVKTLEERIARRVEDLPYAMDLEKRAEAITRVEAEEEARPVRLPVAGFDHTFSVPKSVSALWAVADGGTQALIAQAHRNAITEVLDLFERDLAMTRVGADAGDGSVAQVEVLGIIATAYDHFDSRSSDPQLHTHVVIANRVQGAHDQKWRTLDGRPVHRAVVALSEHYNAVLADHLTRDLGLAWDWRDRGERRNRAYEITGVPDALLTAFSSRSQDIEQVTDELIDQYRQRRGREPSQRTIIRLRAEATLRTRPEKQKRSLESLVEQWRSRASRVLGEDATDWASTLTRNKDRERAVLLRADDIPLDVVDELGQEVVAAVSEKRSTWQRWNIYAETARRLMDVRFASTVDREAVTGLIVDAAERHSLRLTPPELAHSPVVFQREDGSSVFRPKHGAWFSSAEMLAAEDRLLERTTGDTAPTVDLERVDRAVAKRTSSGHYLMPEQAAAVTRVAVSGRIIDALVGPAGTGKTTTLSALRRAWESEHGNGTVVGLAPSDAAAAVLGKALKIQTENTVKWEWEHDHGRWNFQAGQLVIVDEASMCGTRMLDTITAHAETVGAKVLLVGDDKQLDAVDPSGAFGLIVRTLGEEASELTGVMRFTAEWERNASLALRLGEADALDEYEEQGRIRGGAYDGMLDAAYTAWLHDTQEGRSSLMMAETLESVTALNLRARLDRITTGIVDPKQALALHDGTEAAVGDRVVTRRSDRRLRLGRSAWVQNGQLWNVEAAHQDGSMTVSLVGKKRAAIRLPAAYVRDHVELGYAVTAHRSQGSTVDTGHVIVQSPQMTREALYVAMTRGRAANRTYVATDQWQLEDHQTRPDEEVTARSVLEAVLSHAGAELSAHERIEAEQEAWSGIGQLAAEYDTIAQTGQQARWISLLEQVGFTPEQVDAIVEADSFGPLSAELRRADANHYVPEELVPRILKHQRIENANDPGAVLRQRIQRAIQPRTGSSRVKPPSMIAGLIPRATGVTDPDLQQGLAEREQLIKDRARALVETAIVEQAPWIVQLGKPPSNRQRPAWYRHAETVAAYRDRYRITTDAPLGPAPDGTAQRVDHARAKQALARAKGVADSTPRKQRRQASAPQRQAPSRSL